MDEEDSCLTSAAEEFCPAYLVLLTDTQTSNHNFSKKNITFTVKSRV